MNRNRKYPWRESTIALPPGQWVTRGAIKVYQAAQPQLDFTAVPDIADTEIVQEVWDRIAANLTTVAVVHKPIDRALCDDCGCLIAPAERCPRCLVWALKDEQQWEWARESRANRHIVWDILDARKSVAA